MNTVILMGRLTKDPEIRQGSTVKVASYTLAVDPRRRPENRELSASFIPVKAFDKGADFAQEWLHKGTKVIVKGRLQTGSYTKQDGTKAYTWDVIAEDQEFAESKSVAEQNAVQNPGKPADNFLDIADAVDDPGLPFV